MFVPCPGVAEVALLYTKSGSELRTVLHFYSGDAGPITVSELTGLGVAVNDAWDSALQLTFATDVVYRGCQVVDLTTATSPGVEIPLATPLAGIMGGQVLPNNVALAIKKLTLMRGRSFRGRIYHFGFSAAALSDSDHMTSGTVTNMISAYETFFAAVEGLAAPFVHVVVSRYSGVESYDDNGRTKYRPIPRVEGLHTPVVNLAADTALDSQRRRLAGRGI